MIGSSAATGRRATATGCTRLTIQASRGSRPRSSPVVSDLRGALADPHPADGPADQVTPFLAQPGLVRLGRPGERVPGAAEHPEREPGQAARCPVLQVA